MIESDSLAFTGERFIPGIPDRQLAVEHIQRYLAISRHAAGKTVLDAACGEGYGSDLLAHTAASVTGLDVSEEAVSHARRTYSRNNLTFLAASIGSIPLPDQSVDLIVSFETIEHVPEAIQFGFLAEAARILKADGQLVISTPNRVRYTEAFHQVNPFHLHEFSPDEFLAFLRRQFPYVSVYQQTTEIVNLIYQPGCKSALVLMDGSDYTENGRYEIAIASGKPIYGMDLSCVSLPWTDLHQQAVRRILSLQDEVEERNAHIRLLDAEIEVLRQRAMKQFELESEIAKMRKQLQQIPIAAEGTHYEHHSDSKLETGAIQTPSMLARIAARIGRINNHADRPGQ